MVKSNYQNHKKRSFDNILRITVSTHLHVYIKLGFWEYKIFLKQNLQNLQGKTLFLIPDLMLKIFFLRT